MVESKTGCQLPASPMQSNPPKKILVWDIPVRLFHWLLAGSFLSAFAVANLVDDDSSLFALHMLLGAVVAFMVLLRLLWGLAGSRHARFRSFAFGPRALGAYLRATIAGRGERYAGHNPGSSWAVFAMLALALGLALTGVLMSRGGELVEELHEILAWTMVAVVGVHVVGVVWHTIRHKENVARSMIDGHKQGVASDAIGSQHGLIGIAFLALTGLWAGALYGGYDAARSQVRLPLIGSTIQLGDGEEHAEHGEHDEHDAHHDHD
jgi:cytochrome b